MSDECIVSVKSSMQFLLALMQKIVLKMVEEEYPEWREFMLCCVLV
jgi:hypothetical protein